MNLSNFEQYFDETILERGLDYYKSGSVVSLEYDGDEWIAEVEGGDDYTVTVKLSDNGELLDSECDCPYDWGEYCKHQAAVLFALRNKSKSDITSATTVKRKSLENTLKNLDKQTLLSIVLEFANRNKRIKEELHLRYDEKPDMLKSARDIIKSTIADVSRRGYIEYGDTDKATNGADTVLQIIDGKIDDGDNQTSVFLCIVVLEEMMDLLGYCDDSDGVVGGTICEAIEKIGVAVTSIENEPTNNKKVFDTIFNHALNSIYDGWTDWRMDLLFCTLPLCGSRASRDKLERYISERQGAKADGWSREYEDRQLQKLQYELLERFDGKSAADSYMEQHLENSDFRRIAIKNALSGKQYEKALELCIEGENKDSSYAGLVKEWKEFRYIVLENTDARPAQKSLALDLLLDGDFEYFVKLKSLYEKDEWTPILHDILEKSKTSNRSGVYVKILILEKLKSQLLEYCKRNMHSINLYYTHLLPEFKNDVGAIFVKYITESAACADGRSRYREICGLIKHYKKACGSKSAYVLRDELKAKYVRRPAFLDELSKV